MEDHLERNQNDVFVGGTLQANFPTPSIPTTMLGDVNDTSCQWIALILEVTCMVTPAQSEKQATLLWLPFDNAVAHKNKEFGISRKDSSHRLCNVRSSFKSGASLSGTTHELALLRCQRGLEGGSSMIIASCRAE